MTAEDALRLEPGDVLELRLLPPDHPTRGTLFVALSPGRVEELHGAPGVSLDVLFLDGTARATGTWWRLGSEDLRCLRVIARASGE